MAGLKIRKRFILFLTGLLVFAGLGLGTQTVPRAEAAVGSSGDIAPLLLEDFIDVSDWTDVYKSRGTFEAIEGVGVLTSNSDSYGYVGKSVTYNVSELPILHLKIDSVDEGGLWALKLNAGDGDKTIQGDTNVTGEVAFDLRKNENTKNWSGVKKFELRLMFGSNTKNKSYRISELWAEPGAPSTPSGLVASAGDSSATLMWNTSAGTVSYNVYQYEGMVAPVNPADWKLVGEGVTDPAYTVKGLTNGTSYTFAVKATNALGASDYSGTAIARPEADGSKDEIEPLRLEDFSDGDVSNWTDLVRGTIEEINGAGVITHTEDKWGNVGIPVTYNVTDLPILRIKIDGVDEGITWALKLKTSDGELTVVTDTVKTGEFAFDLRKADKSWGMAGLKNFTIRLVYPSGTGNKSFRISELWAEPPAAPAAPNDLVATVGNSWATLSWNDIVDASGYGVEDRYDIYQYEGSTAPENPADWERVGTDVPDATFTATGLTIGKEYAFAVKAKNAEGESDYSAVAIAAPIPTYKLNLMTFNIKDGSGVDAELWNTRKRIFTKIINDFAPDVFGMQEAHNELINYLIDNLDEQYASIGVSRYGNTEEEYNNILYRTDKFEVVDSGTFWLSDTPNLVGSKSLFDPQYPRIATWAKFKVIDNPQAEFYYFNTHFSTKDEAKKQGSSVILDQMDQIVYSPDVPVFLGGDLNADTDNAAFKLLENSSLNDTWTEAGHSYTDDGTYGNFEGLLNEGHIDWIFERNVNKIQSIKINHYNEGGVYPSDHYPVELVVEIPLTGRVGATVPGAPHDVYAASDEGLAKVLFVPSRDDGGSEVLNYKVTVLQGGIPVKTVKGDASPISVTGLDKDGEYTFTVSAVNAVGESAQSNPSKPIYELANEELGLPYLAAAVSSDHLVSGKITITPTNNPVDDQEYALFWGNASGKLSEVPIATIPVGNMEDVNYTFDKKAVPSEAAAILVYTRILGFQSTAYSKDVLPTAGVQPLQIEDFSDVSDWTDLRYGKVTATDGVGTISVNEMNYDGTIYKDRSFGYAGIPVSYNLTDLPILRVKIDSLDDGAKWALKLHTEPHQSGGDITIQGDTDETGVFTFDLRKITSWDGNKDFIIKVFAIGVGKSLKVSELRAEPAVVLPAEPSESSTPSDNGNTPVTDNPVKSTSGSIVIPAGKAGEVGLEDAALVKVPAGAAEQELRITIEKLLDATPWKTDQGDIVSHVFEMLKNVSGNFKKPVTISLKFDQTAVKAGQRAAIFYYDEAKKVWVEIGGKIVGDRITAEVNHFTKFAVLAVEQADGEPSPSLPTFSDIEGHWANSSIISAVAKKLVVGYPDGTFKPNKSVTRAEFTIMLMNALKKETTDTVLTFKDRDKIGEWAAKAVAQAVEAGIVSGYEDGNFRPNTIITRSEMAVMIAKALQLPADQATDTGFVDDEKIPQWAKSAVRALTGLGIISGRGGDIFAPNDSATRAEAVTLLLNMLDK